MYVIKFDRQNLLWTASLFEKNWSDELLSHTIKDINKKSFIFKFNAKRWAYKTMCKSLIDENKMEIIDG